MNNTNFDSIAPIYASLSRLVFGNALRRAQTEHLALIPPNSNVLLIGGGSGWLLEQLLRLQPLAEVTYLEVSPRMLQLAQRRMSQQAAAYSKIKFRLGDESSLQPDETFDVILTPFLLDLFPDERLLYLMDRLFTALRQQGLWLFSDFWPTHTPAPVWQQLLLRSMYTFFGKVSRVSASRLPDFERHFARLPLQELQAAAFYSGLVQAKVYLKV
ncbi:class I SAM-dependent methyltransferase [Pontibacter virosus]|uniref:Ubiquinone/menaquinone biosynthesis C-methylase UbiE n=1 Tax=Pontibacter virosus TaxID=1765052 RepID=A0A2U1B387_9BACT|nr:class I SAM-dependent methyltransferase [Pontibacter virosus]PVY43062.1 ubiquinone/menaquinone biosynthesis C-methylase UbiE [Pontibacter virosus]